MNPDLHRIFCNNGGAAQVEQERANESRHESLGALVVDSFRACF